MTKNKPRPYRVVQVFNRYVVVRTMDNRIVSDEYDKMNDALIICQALCAYHLEDYFSNNLIICV